MTHNEVNSSRTCATHKYSTVIDKKTRYCLKCSGRNDGKIRHINGIKGDGKKAAAPYAERYKQK